MKPMRAIALSVALSAPAVACAPAMLRPPETSLFLATVYDVQAAPAPAGEQLVARGEPLLEQPMRFRGLFELDGTVPVPAERPRLAQGTSAPGAGSLLFEVKTGSAIVGCVLPSAAVPTAGQWLPCLVDANRDGRFEGLFFGRSADIPVPTVSGYVPLNRIMALAEPVGYRRLDPAAPGEPLSVSIRHSNRFDLLRRSHIETWVQGPLGAGRLPGTVAFRPSGTPDDILVLNARLRLRSAPDRAIEVQVLEPMPPQALTMPDVRKNDWIPIPIPMQR